MDAHQAGIYKQEVARYYALRSARYDGIAWHDRIARTLADGAHFPADARILDVATGTGMLAFHAASRLGPQGTVIGVDISAGMLDEARAKLTTAQSGKLRFEAGDGEALDFPPGSFDVIFCSSAFILMTDLDATLKHWRTLLKPRGRVGFHAFSEQAFVAGVVAQTVLRNLGVDYAMNRPTGTVARCRSLLERAGYRNIDIRVEEAGQFISLAEAKDAWVSLARPAPGQFPHPLSALTPGQLAAARAEYEREMEKRMTDAGIWNDMTTFYVYGEK